ncbi:hypothetical protein OAK19_00235 [Aureispira]|nr:hypothetical protein [Aureispira sp.]
MRPGVGAPTLPGAAADGERHDLHWEEDEQYSYDLQSAGDLFPLHEFGEHKYPQEAEG